LEPHCNCDFSKLLLCYAKELPGFSRRGFYFMKVVRTAQV
jgi:hypothetical protein